MSNSIYNESFLPLRFFLNTLVVHCPSCQERAIISTDMPLVADQEPVLDVLNHCGTFFSGGPVWSKGRFLCLSCQKSFEIDAYQPAKTWYGPVEAIAEGICTACRESGYKKTIRDIREHKSKNQVPEKTILE